MLAEQLSLGVEYWHGDFFDAAESVFKDLKSRATKVLGDASQVMQLAHANLGVVHRDQGRLKEAREVLNACLAIAPVGSNVSEFAAATLRDVEKKLDR